MVSKNSGKTVVNPNFIEEELFLTKHALFNAKTVRELKFLQAKINYLKQRMKELDGR